MISRGDVEPRKNDVRNHMVLTRLCPDVPAAAGGAGPAPLGWVHGGLAMSLI